MVASVTGFVSIVGAGPWDPQLLTLAARDRVANADVLIVDYLVNPAVLLHARPDAVILQRQAGPHNNKRLSQETVNELLVEHAKAGSYVVRLKGGDPMVFGRGAEEAQILQRHGIGFEFVPGVTSPIAGPESAGIPVTHRDFTPAVTFVSGFEAYEKSGLHVEWEHLAKGAGTLVLMMSVKNCDDNVRRLIAAGRSPSTPAAIVRWGTRGIQKTITGTLQDIAEKLEQSKIRAPALLVVGEVVGVRKDIAWLEQFPLHGKRIVVTRGVQESIALVESLSAFGADPVCIPGIAYDAGDVAQLDACLQKVSSYHGILLTSPRGVQALGRALKRLQLDLRAYVQTAFAVVGPATASALAELGIYADVVASPANSEGLVEKLSERDALGKSWLHLRGDEGRHVLANAITEAGGSIDTVVAYRIRRPKVPDFLVESLRGSEDGGEGVDAICFASGKTASHFLETAREALTEVQLQQLLQSAKIVVVGPITQEAVQALGIRVDQVGIKATTNETLGFLGRREGMAAMAVASVDFP